MKYKRAIAEKILPVLVNIGNQTDNQINEYEEVKKS